MAVCDGMAVCNIILLAINEENLLSFVVLLQF